MIILTSSTKATHKAQIRSAPAAGFKKLYTATCPKSELCAAKSVVRKWFGNGPADTVQQITDATEIHQLCRLLRRCEAQASLQRLDLQRKMCCHR